MVGRIHMFVSFLHVKVQAQTDKNSFLNRSPLMASPVFEIDTKGTCLFCLSKNCAQFDGNIINKTGLTTATALQMLFRYLHVDITKAANASSCGSLPLVSSTNLAVSLCDACFHLVDEFLELFQDFERIRLQLEGCTWKLHEFIKNGNTNGEGDRVREYQELVNTSGSGRDHVYARFVEKLRTEISEKCSRKRGSSIPKISLMGAAQGILKSSSELQPNSMEGSPELGETIHMESLSVKMEVEDEDAADVNETTVSCTSSSKAFTPTSNDQEKDRFITSSPPPALNQRSRSNLKKCDKTCPCDVCGKRFSRLSYMKRHRNRIHRTWPFKCDICDKLFLYDTDLQRHLQEIHLKKPVSNSKSFSCDYCGKIYEFKKGLQHHLHAKHSMQLYGSRIPSHISERVFESTVAAIVEKILAPVETGNRAHQKSFCVFCGKALSSYGSHLTVHIVRFHMEKVIENAEKATMIKKEQAPADNDNSTSSIIPCKSECPSVIPIQVENEEDWCGFELEGEDEEEEHSLADEDPLGM